MGLYEYFYTHKAAARNAQNIAAIIGANTRRASRSGRKLKELQEVVNHFEDVVVQLEEDLDFLILIVLTLYATLHEKGLITRDALLRRVEEIDLYDGKKDGKVTPAALRHAFGF
jgi:hypothetical protein